MWGWTSLLGGLLIWAVHFFALYIIASVFLTTPQARILVLIVTASCLVALVLQVVRVSRRAAPTPLDSWMRIVALCGLGLSGVAIIWQVLPAVVL